MWLKRGCVASIHAAGGGISDVDSYAGKLRTMRYFFRYKLPTIYPRTALLRELDNTFVGACGTGF